jgi:hypothetical protein
MDVRDGIRIFKEDIISRVTSNIFRRVQIWNFVLFLYNKYIFGVYQLIKFYNKYEKIKNNIYL